MKRSLARLRSTLLLSLLTTLLLFPAACAQDAPPEAASNPTATPGAQPTQTAVATRDPNFVVVATDAPLPPFTQFDPFGTIEGFDIAVMQEIAARAGFEVEFVVTPSQGVLDLLAAGEQEDFDAVMSSLLVPEMPLEGITFSAPYLEVGQVVLVLADEEALQSAADLGPGIAVGVQAGSQGETTAVETLDLAETDLFNDYEQPQQLVQALIDETVRAVIIDSFSANYFAASFPQQLKILGGAGEEAWISRKSYGIAVAADDTALLDRLNEAIAQMKAEDLIQDLSVTWLIQDEALANNIDPGESRVGTPADELFIGLIGQLQDMDPATLSSDFINWEIMANTMSGLYGFDAANELQPLLAAGPPQISEDKLEYTIPLKPGLQFPDGTNLTAEDVRWSVIRSSRLGNFLVNGYLKDSNDDNFADVDAVQVINDETVKLILNVPTSYFPSLLATPPYAPISSDCYSEAAQPESTCGGLGPYRIESWTVGERMRLEANPDWPGTPAPQTQAILIRFYEDVESLRTSLAEFQSIDLAWTGLPYSEFNSLREQDLDGDGQADFVPWTGPSTFKSYLIFEQGAAPWDNRLVRQAAALALDRGAIVEAVFGEQRLPLLSPVPNDVPGHVAVLPAQDIPQAQALMLQAGYTAANPLAIDLWYVNDGRYSAAEEAYITAVAAQLEATEVFEVNVNGAPWDEFRVQIAQCGYPAYLLGWPSPGRPVDYLDTSSWTDFFVQQTDSVFCSNYESAAMDALVLAGREELDPAARAAIIAEMQALWAEELPTLDLTQEPRYALSLPKIGGVQVDALGLMRYEFLTKQAE